jgi:hypothetical protein
LKKREPGISDNETYRWQCVASGQTITAPSRYQRAIPGLNLDEVCEEAGVEFIDENGGGPGVRLRKPK